MNTNPNHFLFIYEMGVVDVILLLGGITVIHKLRDILAELIKLNSALRGEESAKEKP